MKPRPLFLAITLTLCLAASLAAFDNDDRDDSNRVVLSPNSKPNGNTYAEWNALWWRWFLALPKADQLGAPGVDCSTGQVGSVWFLVGLGGPTTINCTVPHGKMLFFPIINAECSDLEDPPFRGETEAERRSCADGHMDTVTNLSARIDGVPVQNLRSGAPV